MWIKVPNDDKERRYTELSPSSRLENPGFVLADVARALESHVDKCNANNEGIFFSTSPRLVSVYVVQIDSI